MANEIDKVDEPLVEEDLTKLDDSTDWKAKAEELEQKRREDGIKQRERTRSLKAQLEELKSKPPEPPKKEDKPEDFSLLHKGFLRMAGIADDEEVELAKSIQKKTGVEWDKLVDDDYFKTKLDGLRASKANAVATTEVRGSGGQNQAKNSPEYWLAQGRRPTKAEVPDRATRVAIIQAFAKGSESGGTFYNE